MLEEYRARVIERNRGSIWAIKEDMLFKIKKRKGKGLLS